VLLLTFVARRNHSETPARSSSSSVAPAHPAPVLAA